MAQTHLWRILDDVQNVADMGFDAHISAIPPRMGSDEWLVTMAFRPGLDVDASTEILATQMASLDRLIAGDVPEGYQWFPVSDENPDFEFWYSAFTVTRSQTDSRSNR